MSITLLDSEIESTLNNYVNEAKNGDDINELDMKYFIHLLEVAVIMYKKGGSIHTQKELQRYRGILAPLARGFSFISKFVDDAENLPSPEILCYSSECEYCYSK